LTTEAVQRLRAVLVDDTPDIRLLLRTALEGSGRFTVVGEAGDGAAGIGVVAATQPDVVLLDLAMPVMDGLEALPAIRRAAPRARIGVLSGFDSDPMLRRAQAAGADVYLQKGINPFAVVDALLAVAGAPPGRAPRNEAAPAPAARSENENEKDAGRLTEAPWLRTAITGAVHEIRNPTVVIAGAVAALTGDGPPLPPERRDELLAAIARQARLLDRATGDLLTAAQAHHGSLHVDPRPVDLAATLAAAVADAPGIDAAVDCPPGLVVLGDPLRLQQMLLNLLSNAAKYGAPPVTVHAEKVGDAVRLGVHDAGEGVPEDFRPALFEEFARAPGRGANGSGVGLFVVRSLAEAQGGSAWYRPAPGGGSVFGFTLPAVVLRPPAQGAPGRVRTEAV
jgi:signal transduction histidine kinase